MLALARDLGACALLFAALAIPRHYFWFRGLTYRVDSHVLPIHQERCIKAFLYFSILCCLDVIVRRGVALAGFYNGLQALAFRIILLWIPVTVWVTTGPLQYTSRDDSGFTPSSQRWSMWRLMSSYLFKSTRMLLSEEWCSLPIEKVRYWQEREAPFVIPMHPHGLLPMGGIINGLTWYGGGETNGGGCEAATTSGATSVKTGESFEPVSPGPLLHQRMWPNLSLRCAVASGVFLPPGFFETYRALGAIECTKPYIKQLLRSGKSVALYPGGATESRFATPGRYVCYCKSRKGFIKVALEERLHLLPIWTFGDEGIVPQPWDPPAVFVKLQNWIKECVGLLVPPLPIGFPKFPPLTSVVGVPVDLSDLWPKVVGDVPPQGDVDKAHARYMDAMQRLFDQNKSLVPGGHSDAMLEFL